MLYRYAPQGQEEGMIIHGLLHGSFSWHIMTCIFPSADVLNQFLVLSLVNRSKRWVEEINPRIFPRSLSNHLRRRKALLIG